MRKSARQQAKANLRNDTVDLVEDLTGGLLERQISEVEERIGSLLVNEAVLAETAAVLRSVPGIGPAVCAMPAAEMPELGEIIKVEIRCERQPSLIAQEKPVGGSEDLLSAEFEHKGRRIVVG